MRRLIAGLFVGALVLGIGGLAFTQETSAQQLPPAETRFDLSCDQTQDPTADNGFVGVVECTLTVDVPDEASPPLPDTIEVSFTATYNDNDESGDPSPGDSLKSLDVSVPDSPTPEDTSPPA